jgi:hypothetical protein
VVESPLADTVFHSLRFDTVVDAIEALAAWIIGTEAPRG